MSFASRLRISDHVIRCTVCDEAACGYNAPGPVGVSSMQQTALKYDTEVKDGGRLELDMPLAPGAHVTGFVIESPNGDSDDLVLASQSSLEFWDNPLDDDWK
jgi:hypothetical protein